MSPTDELPPRPITSGRAIASLLLSAGSCAVPLVLAIGRCERHAPTRSEIQLAGSGGKRDSSG
ncbi:MAG TPA: hypothetical protein VGY66_24070, partial [Gemmataceae bacterium]|nr:hypothetical protein [Gemmataceae bacterium]